MPFPNVVLDQRIEILLGATWTDITHYVQRRQLVTIRRGRSDEASSLERSTARMAINNRDGRFSVRNPLGPYYGILNRNTQLRVSLPAPATYLRLQGTAVTDRAACPDATALGITGDIDIRVDATLDTWRSRQHLAGKLTVSGNQRSWYFDVLQDGSLRLTWSTDGTFAGLITATSTAVVPLTGSRRSAVRVTLDVNNGAGGCTTTFYYADTISGTWTQLGDPVVVTGTTSIFDSTASVEVGTVSDLHIVPSGFSTSTFEYTAGQIHAFQLRSGIGGTVVANPDFTTQAAGASSFADTASPANTWSVGGAATLDNRDYRFHGEVPAWPSRWDVSGNDIWVPIEASGYMRRGGQGSRPLDSTLRRALTTLSTRLPIAYWPCEDASGSTVLSSGLAQGRPMTVTGSSNYAASSAFACSAPVPTVNNAAWTGDVPLYTSTGNVEARFLLLLPNAGLTNGIALARMLTRGSVFQWDLAYTTASGGSLNLLVYGNDGSLLSTGTALAGLNGKAIRVIIWATQNGANVDYGLTVQDIAENFTTGVDDTIASKTIGAAFSMAISPGSDVGDAAVGHISVHDVISEPLLLADELSAYNGEVAGRRIQRLCMEEGVPFRHVGNLDDSLALGPQGVSSFQTLVNNAAATDSGLLYEPRQALGLGYRTRTSLYDEPVTCTLDYSAGQLDDELLPTDDDLLIRNDVTASRSGGSSARATAEDGMLTPDAIGAYVDSITVYPQADAILEDIAGWQVRLGTVDEDRYPKIAVNLANPRVAANTALVASIATLDLGDRLRITNPPSGQAPGPIDQLVQGSTETLGNYERAIAFNTSPASPYNVLALNDSTYGRLDGDTSVLGAAVTSSATTLLVATTQSDGAIPIWTQAAGDYPQNLVVGGEVVTASACTSLAEDNFNRTVAAGGWGTASDSHTYTLTGGSASERSVASNRGVVTLGAPTTNIRHQTVSETCMDADVRVGVSVSATATGGSLVAVVLTRYQASSTNYRARIEFTTAGGITLNVAQGGTLIGSSVATGLTYTAGAIIRAHVRVVGDRVLARVWPDGTSEPLYWHIDRTVTSSMISSGQVGLAAVALAGNTNVNPEVRFDDWVVESPQRMTVTRSVNGIVKAQTAGTPVRIVTPVALAL